jgi:gliding motility-associated-like protein
MKTLLLASALALLGLGLSAQNISWQRIFSCENLSQGHSLCKNDNHYFTLSEISDGIYGLSDLIVTKRDSLGQILWNRIIGSSRLESGMNAVIRPLSDQAVLIIGFSKESATDDRDVFCCKLASDGEVVWSRTIPFLNGNEVPRDAIEMSNGDIVIVGSIVSQSFGSNDGFILRLNPEGNMIWGQNVGGAQNDHFYGVKSIPNGIIVTGTCQSLDNIHRAWIVNFSNDGSIIAEKVFSLNLTELFMSVATGNNSIFTTGYTTDSAGNRHLWVCSISMDFEIQWCIVADDESEGVDIHYNNDLLLIVGNRFETSNTEVLLLKLNLDGSLIENYTSSSATNNFVSPVSGVSNLYGDELVIVQTNLTQPDTTTLISKLNINSIASCQYDEDLFDFQFNQLDEEVINSSIQILPNLSNYSLQSELYYSFSDSLICSENCDVFLDFPDSICSNDNLSINFSNSQNSEYYWNYEEYTILNHDSILIESTSNETLTINLISFSQIEACSLDSTFSIEILTTPELLSFDTTICVGTFFLSETDQIFSDDFFWDFQSIDPFGITDSSFQLTGSYFNTCGSSEFNMNFTVINNAPFEVFPEYSCDTINFELSDNHSWANSTDTSFQSTIMPGAFFQDTLYYENNGCLFSTAILIQIPEALPILSDFRNIVCIDSLNIFINEIEEHFGVNHIHSSLIFANTVATSFLFENQCGTHLIEHTLFIEDCDCSLTNLHLPNAFTPNNDGLNDVFQVVSECPFNTFQLSIFNRFGNLIFQSTNPHEPWLGNVRNGEHYAPNSVYTWQLITSAAHQLPVLQTGHVTLLR